MIIREKTNKVIEKILSKGNSVELKKVNGNLVVIEISRKKQAEEPFKTK